jgi:competence protein ComEC
VINLKKPIQIFLVICFIFSAGFSIDDDIPTDIEKVNLKLNQGEIAVTFLELSSGEAALIHHANGEHILVNTGGPGTEKEMIRLLRMYNVENIKGLILTKDDPEYTSNLKSILKHYQIDSIYIGEHSVTKLPFEKHTIIKWKKQDKKEILPGLSATVLHEAADVKGSLGMDILFTFSKHQFLYMSSANFDVETELLKQPELSKVNILKVADFASDKGTSQPFLEHIDPQVAVIYRKKGVLPSQSVIERLNETWIDIYHIKQFGNISFKCSKDKFEIITISVQSFGEIG